MALKRIKRLRGNCGRNLFSIEIFETDSQGEFRAAIDVVKPAAGKPAGDSAKTRPKFSIPGKDPEELVEKCKIWIRKNLGPITIGPA